MKSPKNFIVKPKNRRYKEGKKIGDTIFETVSSIEDAKDVSKEGIVVAVPLNYKGDIQVGDEVIIHHNIFRMYYDVNGKIKYSRAHVTENLFQVVPEELFMYKKNGEWRAFNDFCFIKPVTLDTDSKIEQTLEHTGIVYASNEHPVGTKIGFTPESEYEVTVDNELLYRMRNSDICLYIHPD